MPPIVIAHTDCAPPVAFTLKLIICVKTVRSNISTKTFQLKFPSWNFRAKTSKLEFPNYARIKAFVAAVDNAVAFQRVRQ
ncbi:MAG TPA: hypothetical protein VLC91_14205, partial [Spongiibacteraceae bacterium]|nr:hypothetical protein [Spongiibacteraceae bacterium]